MKIYLGADHAGFEMKEAIKTMLKNEGCTIEDMGNLRLVKDDDYPDFVYAAARAVAADTNSRGIVFCGTAQGSSMVANKIKGIRAAIGFEKEAARLSREHNNSNVLCLPGRLISLKKAKQIVHLWLTTAFSGEERHIRRLKKLEKIEKKQYGIYSVSPR